jgi:hypothetical protein
MSYISDVRSNVQQIEYQKFVQINDDARFPPISVIRNEYADSSTASVSSLSIYPKTAVLTYLTNASDIKLTLSASEVDIGNVGLVDHYSTGFDTYASVIYTNTAPGGQSMGAVSVKTYGVSPVSGLMTVQNPTSAVYINGTTAVSGTVTIQNPTSAVAITNTVAISTAQTLPVSGSVTVLNPVSTVNVTGSVATNFNPTQVDAFNRLRVSNPLTLFDSSHRFRDNNLWSSLTANGGTVSFNLTQGLMDLNVTNAAGASALRETTKVFAYQPGKSLLVMNTFVMGASATGLVQRVGYFGDENGIYFQMEDDAISFVERSIVTGSLVNTVTPRSSWNGDKLNGTGPSGVTLDITKAQIMWMDIEWLGVGTIRTGFIINGQFITCHSFHHANIINSTYITTASLPLRYEIFNKSATAGSKTLKQICSTVISEGGYELRGLQQAIGTPITSPKTLTTQGIFYPVATIRLNPNRLDGIVILTALSIMGTSTGIYNWQVRASGTTTGGSGTWVDAGVDSCVQYKLDATGITGGRILASGFLTANTQSAASVDILKEALFKFQLERNIFTGTPFELTLAVAASTNTELVYGSMDWEEISR